MRKQLIRQFSDNLDMEASKVQTIFKAILDGMVDTLLQEGRLELRGFGIFTCKARKPRKARNPRTGDTVLVPARKVIVFKAATKVQRLLNGEEPKIREDAGG